MRHGVIITIAATACLWTGCDDQARKFAQETRVLLAQRSRQLAAKIAAEKIAYRKAAARDLEDHRALVDSTLRNERMERTDELAADYAEGRKPVSLWRKHISVYARIDYTENRNLLAADMDTESRYLRKFEDLKVEKEKVEALAKLLDALSKKRTLREDVDALAGFAEDTQLQFDTKVCTQLAAKKDGTDADAASAAAAFDTMQCGTILKSKR